MRPRVIVEEYEGKVVLIVEVRENGFSLPTFESNRAGNYFASRLFLHHFLSEEDLIWLRLISNELSDGQKIALIFVREQGAVDNQTMRQLTGSEVLSASHELRKLRDLKLLEAKGKGSATYYVSGPAFPASEHTSFETGHTSLRPEHASLTSEHTSALAKEIPALLKKIIAELGSRPPPEDLRGAIRSLCSIRPMSAAEICCALGRKGGRPLEKKSPQSDAGGGTTGIRVSGDGASSQAGLSHRSINN